MRIPLLAVNSLFFLLLAAPVASAGSSADPEFKRNFAEGRQLLSSRHFPEALAKFDQLLKVNPRSCDVLSLRARVLKNMGRDAEASAAVKLAMAADPKSVQPYIAQALICLKDNNPLKAREIAKQADKLEPHNYEVLALIGSTYYIVTNNKEALSYVNEALKLHPDSQRYSQRATIYRVLGDRVNELKDYDKAVTLEPKNPIYVTERATTFLTTKRLKEARNEINRAIILDPKYGQAYYIRANINWSEKMPNSCLDDMAKAISLDPLNSTFYYFRGTVYEQQGEWKRALDDQLKADKLNPNQPYIKGAAARMYHKMLEPKPALEAATAAIKLDPKNSEYYEIRSEIYHTLMEFDLSVADDSKAIEYAKKPPINPLVNRIRYYRMQKKFDLALKDQNKMLSYFPKKIGLLENRASLYAEMGDFKGAKEDLDKLIARFPADNFYASRANANYHLKNYTAALEDCNKAIAKQPTMSNYFLLRSQIHQALGKMDLARKDKAAARAADEANLPPR